MPRERRQRDVIRRGDRQRFESARERRQIGKDARSRRAQDARPSRIGESKKGVSRRDAVQRALERRQQRETRQEERALRRQQAIDGRQKRDNRRDERALQRKQAIGKGDPGAREKRAAERRERNLVRRGKGDRPWVLRNRGFAERAARARNRSERALARATFGGHFARHWRDGDRRRFRHRRHRHHVHVIGWIGPVFWPFAYHDFVDYTFWPHAYDAFWPYAYDEVYEGFFGPYAIGGPVYAGIPAGTSSRTSGGRRTAARSGTRASTGATAQICTGETAGLTDWPIDRIAETVNPNDAQRALLEQLQDAATRAVDLLRSACPEELPSTPTGRMAAMRERLEIMREAVQIVRPALAKFYQSLNDEQKARFNAFDDTQPAAGERKAREAELAQACSGKAAKATAAPTNRIEQALRLSEAQRTALEDLNNASAKAAAVLMENCSVEEALTPPGRLAAMEQRLDAMLKALDMVQPALARFYDSLSDEQKARLNRLEGPRQAAR